MSALRRGLAMLPVLMLAACAGLPMAEGLHWGGPPTESGNVHLDFLLDARASDGAGRELLWRQARNGLRRNAATELHLGLLQTLDGHSGHDPVAGEKRLKTLRARKPTPEIDSVARLRLAELQELRGWRQQAEASNRELDGLKSRLTRLVDIERGSGGQRP